MENITQEFKINSIKDSDVNKEEELFSINDNKDNISSNINNNKIEIEEIEEFITAEEYLFDCSRFNDIDGLKLVLSDKSLNLNYQNDNKNSALHMASANNNIEALKLLITAGINLDMKNNYGNTALHWAATNNSLECAKLLIDNKADYKIKNDEGKTASEEAFDRQYYDISDYIISNESDISKSETSSFIKEEDAENDPEALEIEKDLKETEDKILKSNHIENS